MSDHATSSPTTTSVAHTARRQRGNRLRTIVVAVCVLALVAIGGLAFAASQWKDAEPQGLVFVIPEGRAEELELPTIDSAIDIPTEIRFGPGEVASITIINNDTSQNRAGPFLVDAGQTYTLKFDKPGVYQFDCTVDASESVTVIVSDK